MSEEFKDEEILEDEFTDEPLGEEDISGDESKPEDGSSSKTFTQEELEAVLARRLARDRKQQSKKIEETFGTSNFDEVKGYYQAGRAVTQASGKTPAEVLNRLSGGKQMQTNQSNDVTKEIAEIKQLLSDQKVQETRTIQEKEAKKEFGNLYDSHKEDIEDMAEERGLALVDAAAIVLRPKLKEVYQSKSKAQQEHLRRKRIEGGGEPPAGGGGEDIASKLSTAQMNVAKKMGIPLKKYYASLKALGEIED